MADPRDAMYRALDTLGLLEKLLDPHQPLLLPERAELGLVLMDLLRTIQVGVADLERDQTSARPHRGGEEVRLV